MSRQLIIRRTIPAMLLAAWLGVATAQAFGGGETPSGSGVMLDHPQALEIAIATRTAIEKGILPKPAPAADAYADPDPQDMPGEMLQRRLRPGHPASAVELIVIDKGIHHSRNQPGEKAPPATVQFVSATRTLQVLLADSMPPAAATAAGLFLLDVQTPGSEVSKPMKVDDSLVKHARCFDGPSSPD